MIGLTVLFLASCGFLPLVSACYLFVPARGTGCCLLTSVHVCLTVVQVVAYWLQFMCACPWYRLLPTDFSSCVPDRGTGCCLLTSVHVCLTVVQVVAYWLQFMCAWPWYRLLPTDFSSCYSYAPSIWRLGIMCIQLRGMLIWEENILLCLTPWHLDYLSSYYRIPMVVAGTGRSTVSALAPCSSNTAGFSSQCNFSWS